MSVPEGKETITAEGRDLRAAIQGAAQQLGLHPTQVDYKLDMSHFRSLTGAPVARDTVRIIAWGSDRPVPAADERPRLDERAPRAEGVENGVVVEASEQSPARAREDRGERGERRERRDRGEREERGPRAERGERRRGRRGGRESAPGVGEEPRAEKPESLRGAEAGPTEASEYAQRWFSQLMELMGVTGTVTGTGSPERVHLAVKAERAGRIVGKRGATLGSIRHLLGLALEHKFGATPNGGPLTIDVDVGDDRPREEREPREREPRPERGERRGRERGGRESEKGRYPEDKLRALARRAAEKAAETGQTITINLELNSFDRRIVHLEVAEIDGVESQSEERTSPDGRTVKFVQISPLKA